MVTSYTPNTTLSEISANTTLQMIKETVNGINVTGKGKSGVGDLQDTRSSPSHKAQTDQTRWSELTTGDCTLHG